MARFLTGRHGAGYTMIGIPNKRLFDASPGGAAGVQGGSGVGGGNYTMVLPIKVYGADSAATAKSITKC